MSDEEPLHTPDEFEDPEGSGEKQDPDLADPLSAYETTTKTLRELWAPWMCRKGTGRYVDIVFFGRKVGGVPEPAVDAYRALEAALRATGYEPKSRWAYNCRRIGGTDSYSLHSAGIAIDIDPALNPYSEGERYSGKLKPHHVAAVLAIKNSAGDSVWSWGGNWAKPDRMHFQLNQGPRRVDIAGVDKSGEPAVALMVDEEAGMLGKGAKGKAVVEFQTRLVTWDAAALAVSGVDGSYGDETAAAVRRFQEAQDLEQTGRIDGVTAALLLAMHRG
jgi:peptidoglycan hydrolase-like protein with peptidoglycan-binding domain